jgi:hypothetical protein
MKTSSFNLKLFVFVIVLISTNAKVIKSQSYLQVGTTVSPFINYSGSLFIGSGNLQIKTITNFPIYPLSLYKSEVWYLGTQLASVQHLLQLGSQNYGIYQTSAVNSNLLNYFQDPVKIGSIAIIGSSSGPVIATDPYITSLTFRMNPNSGPVTNPLIIYGNGIRVQSNLVTDNFQMLTNPGTNKILASDAAGNGSWIDPSTFMNNYWLLNKFNNLYTFKNVGVQTQFPSDLFQVDDGAYKFVVGDARDAALGYGTSYLGFNAFKNNGIWTISSDGNSPNDGHNGGAVIYGDVGGALHFINVPTQSPGPLTQTFTNSQMVGMTSMTILQNGNVGIGTNSPTHKLDISTNADPNGIRINQTGNSTDNRSEIEFDHNSQEDWAIGSNAKSGNSYFYIWSNTNKVNGNAFFIDGNNGMTGIGTWWPSAKLEVAGNFKATAVGIGIDPPLSTDSYKLFVAGGIAAQEVKVTSQTFPDYCFADDYQLMSIPELRKYIAQNKHLPGLPSAKEVADNNGFELGDMQKKLVEKVEQQTLYILDLQKQINELKQQMESLIKK